VQRLIECPNGLVGWLLPDIGQEQHLQSALSGSMAGGHASGIRIRRGAAA
jgi:hypothetical protein